MSHIETRSTTPCVPVSTLDTPSPRARLLATVGDATGRDSAETGAGHGVTVAAAPAQTLPVTRGPSDCWHSEEYLIGWLVKTHGWYVLEPGVLRRRWRPRPPAVAGPLQPEQQEIARDQEVAA